MQEKPTVPRSLPPRNAPFSFEVKLLLLQMTAATTNVENCLKVLKQEEPALSAHQDLMIKAEEFYSLTCLKLPALCWMAAARELTEAEEKAVKTLQERVENLAGSLSQEPLKQQQEDAEEAFHLIKEVGDNLELIEPSMQQEREETVAKAASEKEEAEKEEHKQWVRGIKGNVISGAIGGTLVLLAGILFKLLFP